MEDFDEELRQALVENVHEIEKKYKYPNGVAFQHWAAVNVLGIKDDEVHETLNRSMGEDRGIDYFRVDDEAQTVEIIQAKFHKNLDSGASREDLSSFFRTIDRLNEGGGGNESFRTYQDQYKKAVSKGFETKLIFVMTGSLTEENNEEINVWRRSNSASNIRFECLETKDLLRLIDNPNSPPCKLRLYGDEVFVSSANNGIRKIVATVSAKELKKMYEKIGEYVFSENPRYFLGQTTISKDIKKTLRDLPERLWHYNNGISAICKHFRYNEESSTLSIENLKVVNGCQTVTTIGLFETEIKNNATLLFRLSEVDDEVFRNEISKNTNSQSQTPVRDLNAFKKEFKVLNHTFKKYPKFFWEYKRGQHATSLQHKNKPSKLDKKLYVINIVEAAKLKLAYKLEKPHLSIGLSQKTIFEDKTIGSSKIQPFSDIYKNADPVDFILPRIFYYCLDESRRNDDISEQEQMLISKNIGKYYLVAMIGKIIRSMSLVDQSEISRWIIEAATNQDKFKLKEITTKLESLVHTTAKCLEYVRKNDIKRV